MDLNDFAEYSKENSKKVLHTGKRALKNSPLLIADTGKELLSKVTSESAQFLINYTPDIYDELEDFSTDSSKELAGNSMMLARSAKRMAVSGSNLYHKKRYNKYKRQLDVEKIQKKNAEQNFNSTGYAGSYKKEQNIRNRHIEKLEKKMKKQSGKIHADKGFSIGRSIKGTLSNQSRKLLSRLSYQDDFGTQTIGNVGMTAWGAGKLKNKIVEGARFVKNLPQRILAVFKNIISFVVSIPTMIAFTVSIAPILIFVLLVAVLMIAIFPSVDYTGRVASFSEYEVNLENTYQTALVPDEILAITDVLGWDDEHTVEDYEVLISLIYDGKRGVNLDFNEMLYNIYEKHNPARVLSHNAYINENAIYPLNYWYSDKGINNLGTKTVKSKHITYKQWLKCFPDYLKAGTSLRATMSETSYIEKMKDASYNLLDVNGTNYVATFMEISENPTIFIHPVLQEFSGVSSAVGYRKILLNNDYDSSFHYGTDIPANGGTNVYSPMNATVVYVQTNIDKEGEKAGFWGAGNSVILRKEVLDANGKTSFLYVMFSHLQYCSTKLRTGNEIQAGTHIGKVGSTGLSTGNHLHLQVWLSPRKYNRYPEDKFPFVYPNEFTDSVIGNKYSIDDNDYSITLDGTMLFDIDYRNKLFKR